MEVVLLAGTKKTKNDQQARGSYSEDKRDAQNYAVDPGIVSVKTPAVWRTTTDDGKSRGE